MTGITGELTRLSLRNSLPKHLYARGRKLHRIRGCRQFSSWQICKDLIDVLALSCNISICGDNVRNNKPEGENKLTLSLRRYPIYGATLQCNCSKEPEVNLSCWRLKSVQVSVVIMFDCSLLQSAHHQNLDIQLQAVPSGHTASDLTTTSHSQD